MKLGFLACASLLALSACGSDETAAADYTHFSDFFTLNESTANEMSMDGGTPLVVSTEVDAHAAILSNTSAVPGSMAEAPAANSPAVEFAE